jgi:protein TonB
MFDNVGRSRKADTGRSAGSMLTALAFNGSLIACIGIATTKAPEVAAEIQEKLVAVDLSAPPPPPPPPPPPGGGKKKEKKEKKEEETPVQEVPTTVVPIEETPEPVVDEEVDGGVEGGVEGGVKDGVVGGVVGGVKDGVLGGQLGGTGVKTVHWSEAIVKTRVKPSFPEAAKALGLKKERCIVHIVIAPSGEPSDVSFKACPELFKASAKEAALQWRWYPLMENGQPISAQFDLVFQFNLVD